MKFLIFFEIEDAAEAQVRFANIKKVSEKAKEMGLSTGKALSPPYLFADLRGGIQLLEAESAEALIALASYYYGVSKFKYKPLADIKDVIEIQEKMQKASQ